MFFFRESMIEVAQITLLWYNLHCSHTRLLLLYNIPHYNTVRKNREMTKEQQYYQNLSQRYLTKFGAH